MAENLYGYGLDFENPYGRNTTGHTGVKLRRFGVKKGLQVGLEVDLHARGLQRCLQPGKRL